MTSKVTRSITGFFIAVLFAAVVLLALKVHPIFFDLLVLLIVFVGTLEVCGAIKKIFKAPKTIFVLSVVMLGFCGFLALAYFYVANGDLPILYATFAYLGLVVLAIGLSLLIDLIAQKSAAKKEVQNKQAQKSNSETNENAQASEQNNQADSEGRSRANGTIPCLIYPSVLLIFMLALGHLDAPYRAIALIMLFTVTPLTDVLAYMVGSTLKGKKLCPSISPKKTISGACGGLIGGLIGGALMILLTSNSAFSWLDIGGKLGGSNISNVVHCLLIGLGGSVCTQLGDILASYIKRKCGIKDFSNLLPGHGGVMDRVDGMILNSFYLFIYMSMLALG